MTRTERFWTWVRKTRGCWKHFGSPGSHGYSQFGGELAHRESWVIHFGQIPKGLWVLHNCNNKRCVRPDHLRLGTHEENMDDLAKAGHPRRKLTSKQVRTIRASNRPQAHWVVKYGVSKRAIWNVVNEVTYRHE